MSIESNYCPESVIQAFSEKLKVCGHPLRLKILCLILREDACVTELWKCLQQPQPVISQHLSILREKGIVDSKIEGNKRIYSIIDPFFENLALQLIKKEINSQN